MIMAMARKRIIVEHPSIEQVEFYLRAWDDRRACSKNTPWISCSFKRTVERGHHDILVKASSLSDFYSTNILAYRSQHILELDRDNDYNVVTLLLWTILQTYNKWKAKAILFICKQVL